MKGLLAGAGKVDAGVELGGVEPEGFNQKGLFEGAAAVAVFDPGGDEIAGLMRNGFDAAFAFETGFKKGFEDA